MTTHTTPAPVPVELEDGLARYLAEDAVYAAACAAQREADAAQRAAFDRSERAAQDLAKHLTQRDTYVQLPSGEVYHLHKPNDRVYVYKLPIQPVTPR